MNIKWKSLDARVLALCTASSFLFRCSVLFFCFGFVLNITVIYLTIKNDQLRDRYVLLASISTAHIVVCGFVFPLVIVHHVTSEVIISRVCEFLTCFVVNVASFTMSVIAVRRALALSERFRYKIGEFTYKAN